MRLAIPAVLHALRRGWACPSRSHDRRPVRAGGHRIRLSTRPSGTASTVSADRITGTMYDAAFVAQACGSKPRRRMVNRTNATSAEPAAHRAHVLEPDIRPLDSTRVTRFVQRARSASVRASPSIGRALDPRLTLRIIRLQFSAHSRQHSEREDGAKLQRCARAPSSSRTTPRERTTASRTLARSVSSRLTTADSARSRPRGRLSAYASACRSGK